MAHRALFLAMLCQTLRPQAPTLRSTKPIYKMSSRNTSITTPNFVLQSVCGRAAATWAMCLGLWAPVGPCGGIAKCVGTIEQCLARRGPARAEPSVKWGGPSKDNMRRTIPVHHYDAGREYKNTPGQDRTGDLQRVRLTS